MLRLRLSGAVHPAASARQAAYAGVPLRLYAAARPAPCAALLPQQCAAPPPAASFLLQPYAALRGRAGVAFPRRRLCPPGTVRPARTPLICPSRVCRARAAAGVSPRRGVCARLLQRLSFGIQD